MGVWLTGLGIWLAGLGAVLGPTAVAARIARLGLTAARTARAVMARVRRVLAVLAALAYRAGVRPGAVWQAARDSSGMRVLRGGGVGTASLRGSSPAVKVAMALGALGCLAAVAVSQGYRAATAPSLRDQAIAQALVARQEAAQASRSQQRTSPSPPKASPKRSKPSMPKPVAGLSQTQMNNAYQIVEVGKAMGLPKRAYVIAIATAMQESRLLNLASDVLPESYRYPHQGSGSDHDSVGLFQQRPSTGWGPVKNLMDPKFAATQFYKALRGISGWQNMALTYAAQLVQGSAFPYAYAQHEWLAQQVVNVLT